jgi:hypothetical protein
MIIDGVREAACPGRAGPPIAGVREVAGRAGQAGAPIAGGVREAAGSGRFGRAATPLVVVGRMRAASGSGRMCAERAVTGAAS